ncbi:MAG: NACHT domain-containing protein, partial [Pseudonocardiaceae bacterium]
MGVLHPRRRVVVTGVGLATTVAVATAWMLAQDARGAEIATVLAFLVAIATLLVALIGARSGSDSAEQLLLAARRLARDVRGLETGVLARLMADTGDPAPADLSFAQPALIYWRADGGGQRGTLSEVEGYYRSLDRGRLVVLGEPGAGKTVLAIKLVLDLAAAVLTAPDDVRPFPTVPVRLSLPSFDPGDADAATTKMISTRLDTWLIQHLVTVFGLSNKVARALVTEGWILPVLDGLDEMDIDDTRPLRAAAVVRALNHTSAGGLRPVVVTCRTGRYRQISTAPATVDGDQPAGPKAPQRTVVQDTTVVGVEPLTVQHIVDYLTYRFPDPTNPAYIEPRWRPIIDRLTTSRSGDPLVAAIGSPLRLFLTVTSYRHDASEPDELTRLNTADQIDDHLFARLVPAVIEQHPPAGREYSATTVTRWLTTLARHLNWQGQHGDSPSDLWLHLLWPAAGERAPRYTGAALVIAAPAILLAFMVLTSWSPNRLIILGLGAIVVVMTWRAARPAVGLRRLDLSAMRTSAGRRRIGRRLAGGFTQGLALGLAIEFTFGFSFGYHFGLDQGPRLGLLSGLGEGPAFGIMVGLAGGLVFSLATRPSAIDRPARLAREGILHAVTVLAAFGFTFGLTIGLIFGLAGGLTLVLKAGLTFA